jgi:hypothetical protein
MREARSEKFALRSAIKSSAAETSIFIAESRIRRISPALAKSGGSQKTAQLEAARRTSAPWYGFRANLAIAA